MSSRYEIIRPLGSGGQARVYLARDRYRGDLPVALKRVEADELRRRELAAEFERLASLSHPNLARCFDYGVDDQGAYFTSEYLDGSDIYSWSRARSEEERCYALAAVLGPLALLHDRGLVHSDLSEQNVLVQENGTDGWTPKLIDLGSARRLGQSGGDATVGYGAPEIWSGRGVMPQSDLYSFGVLLARVIWNRRPFGDGDASETLRRQLAGNSELPEASSSSLAALCHRLLALDPLDRPASAAEVLNALAEAADLDLQQLFDATGQVPLSPPRFVGRQVELAGVAALIERVADPAGERVVWISGTAGVGKSAFLTEALRYGQLLGADVLRLSDAGRSISSLVRGLIDRIDTALLSEESAQLLSAFSREGDASRTITSFDADAVGFAVVEALALARGETPLLLAVDDIDEGDPLLQKTILAVARSLEPSRSVRPRALLLASGAPAGVASFQAAAPSQTFVLATLDHAAVSELSRSMFAGLPSVDSEGIVDRVVPLAAGNPGRAVELMRLLTGKGGGVGLMEDAVSQLEPAEQKLLAAMHACGDPLPVVWLTSAPGISSTSCSALLERGFAREVISEDGVALVVRPSAGEAAFELVLPVELAGLVDELTKVFVSEGRRDLAARLFERTERSPEALEAYRYCADEAARLGDVESACHFVGCALALVEDDGAAGSIAQTAVPLYEKAGDFESAIACLERTGLSEVVRTRWEAHLLIEKGEYRRAVKLAQTLEAAEDDWESQAVLAAALLQVGRYQEAFQLSRKQAKRQGAATAEGTERAALARLKQVAGLAACYLDRRDEAGRFLRQAARDYEQIGDRLGQTKVAANMGIMHRMGGDLQKAEQAYERAVGLARALHDRRREGLYLMNRATVIQAAGQLGGAYRDYLAALDIATVLGHGALRVQVETNLVGLLADFGDFAGAMELAGFAIERCRVLGLSRNEARLMLEWGAAARGRGDWLAAERLLTEARSRFAASANEQFRLTADAHLAALYYLMGDVKRARELAAKVHDFAAERGWAKLMVRISLVQAQIALEEDRQPGRALATIEAAKTLLGGATLADDEWQLELMESLALEKAGRRSEAVAAQNAARETFAAISEAVPGDFVEHFAERGRAAGFGGEKPVAAAHEEPSSRARDLEHLVTINRELTAERDSARLLELIMTRAVELTGAERGLVVMPRGGDLQVVVAHDLADEVDQAFSRSVAEKVVSEGRAVLAVNALDDERFRSFVSVNALKLRSILAVPLSIRRKVVGVLYLDSRLKTGVFTDSERQVLEAFGSQAAIALDTARLVSENQRRCAELEVANTQVSELKSQIEEQLQHKEATLRRVEALLERTQAVQSDYILKSGIVGRSPAMQRVFKLIDRLSLTDVPVYIFGDSGTGKELVARALHAGSERKERAFVPVNCGALPPKLLASELFGHRKGAFTGAIQDRPGLFRLADKGTLFLDEVTDMDAEMQASLLRVLQDGTFRPVGGNEEEAVDVRILSASNRDLEQEVKEGRFREDLFYRLNVVRIDVPPLRDRKEDIPLLVDHMLRRHSEGEPPTVSREALDVLLQADWTGNVRELENEVLRALAMAEPGRPIGPEDLSMRLAKSSQAPVYYGTGNLKERVGQFERLVLQQVLEECGGNATRAADELEISRAGLYKKLGKYGMTR